MLDALRNLLTRAAARPVEAAETAEAAAPSGPSGVQIAAAALLLELAHADGEFSPDEQAYVAGAIDRHFGLDDATRTELLALAERLRSDSVDHFQFTKIIAQQYDLGQKLLLAEIMWGVILADGTVGHHEAYLVRKLGHLLDLEPAYLAQARRSAAGES